MVLSDTRCRSFQFLQAMFPTNISTSRKQYFPHQYFNFQKAIFCPTIFQSIFILTIIMILLLILKIIITMITGSASAPPLRIAHPLSRDCSCTSSPHGDQCSRHVEVATFLMTIMLFDDGESLTVLDCENEFSVFIFLQSQPNDCNQHLYCT